MTRTILALATAVMSLPALAGGVPLLGTFTGEVEHVGNIGVRVDPLEFEIYADGNVYFIAEQQNGLWTDLGRVEPGVRAIRIETAGMFVEGLFDRTTRCFEGAGAKDADGTEVFVWACGLQF